MIGLIRLAQTRDVGNGSLAAVYDLTAAGQRAFTAYRRLGFTGTELGFCFGRFRAVRVVRAEWCGLS